MAHPPYFVRLKVEREKFSPKFLYMCNVKSIRDHLHDGKLMLINSQVSFGRIIKCVLSKEKTANTKSQHDFAGKKIHPPSLSGFC